MSGRILFDGLPADVKARIRNRAQPSWIAPMLATLTDEVFSRQGWLFEPKWDGERCLAFRRGRDLNLFSRNQIRLNEKYPEVVEAFVSKKPLLTSQMARFLRLTARSPVSQSCKGACRWRIRRLT